MITKNSTLFDLINKKDSYFKHRNPPASKNESLHDDDNAESYYMSLDSDYLKSDLEDDIDSQDNETLPGDDDVKSYYMSLDSDYLKSDLEDDIVSQVDELLHGVDDVESYYMSLDSDYLRSDLENDIVSQVDELLHGVDDVESYYMSLDSDYLKSDLEDDIVSQVDESLHDDDNAESYYMSLDSDFVNSKSVDAITNLSSQNTVLSNSLSKVKIQKSHPDDFTPTSDILTQEVKTNNFDDKKVNHKDSCATIAEKLMKKIKFILIDEVLFYWDKSKNHYVPLYGTHVDKFMRKHVSGKNRDSVNRYSSQEILQWIITFVDTPVPTKKLKRRESFVAFENCIVAIDDLSIIEHNPFFYFTSVINANYPIYFEEKGENFEKFMYQVTNGDKSLYFRIQELFGYVISEIRTAKILPFLLGPKDSGKSVVLQLLEHLVGKEFVTHYNFTQLNDDKYLSNLIGKKLNTCGEVSEITLSRLDTIKKLTGGDSISARPNYGHPLNFTNTSVLLFAGNHLPPVKTIDSSNAFSRRLLLIPFNNSIPKEKQDKNLLEKIKKESNYIVKWSMIGLKRLINNNLIFTTSEEIENMRNEYSQKTNSVEGFFEQCCILDSSARIYTSELYSAYQKYCNEMDALPVNYHSFSKYFSSQKNLRKSKFRYNDENRNGFIGIKLNDDYL